MTTDHRRDRLATKTAVCAWDKVETPLELSNHPLDGAVLCCHNVDDDDISRVYCKGAHAPTISGLINIFAPAAKAPCCKHKKLKQGIDALSTTTKQL